MSLLINVGNTRTVVVRGECDGLLTPVLTAATPHEAAAAAALANSDRNQPRRRRAGRGGLRCPRDGRRPAGRVARRGRAWIRPGPSRFATRCASRRPSGPTAGATSRRRWRRGSATRWWWTRGPRPPSTCWWAASSAAASSPRAWPSRRAHCRTQAARLWEVPFAPCALRAGRDTDEALAIGAFHVGVNGVRGTVTALLARYPQCAVVVTGGLGAHVTQPGWRHDADWTLRGLAALAAARAR